MRWPHNGVLLGTGLWSHISFSWVGPLIAKSWRDILLQPGDAAFLLPPDDHAAALSARFDAAYKATQVRRSVWR